MHFSRRSAVRARIRQGAVPPGVARAIAVLVRRTRLRASEQIWLAGEWCAEYARWRSEGRSDDEWIAHCAPTRERVRALRTDAIARRGAVDRACGRAFRWASLAVAIGCCAYFIAATVLVLRKPVVGFDALQAMNDRIPKSGPEGSALAVYMQALADAGGVFDSDALAGPLERIDRSLFAIEFDAAAHAEVLAALASSRVRIELLRTVRDRPVLGLALEVGAWQDTRAAVFFGVRAPTGPQRGLLGDSLLTVLLPHLSMLRSSARLMCADAAMAAREGRAEECVADLEAAYAMAGHAGQGGVLIGGLVEAAILQLAHATLVSVLENHGAEFGDEQVARLDRAVRAHECDLARAAEGEKFFVHDLVQRCYSDDGHGDGVLLPLPCVELVSEMTTVVPLQGQEDRSARSSLAFLAAPLVAALAPSRRELLDSADGSIDGIVQALRAPTRAESLALAGEQDARLARARAERTLPITSIADLMLPALGRIVPRAWAVRAARDGALAALGLERFRRAHGRFPNDLAELGGFVGRDLDSACDERLPWSYALVDGRPVIYDAGLDGLDDRARTPFASWPANPEDDRAAADLGPALVSLDAACADADTERGRTRRTRSELSAETPVDPSQPLAEVSQEPVARTDGDFIRVWWKSRAAGAVRMVPARVEGR